MFLRRIHQIFTPQIGLHDCLVSIMRVLTLLACVATASAWQMAATAPRRAITVQQPQPAVCPAMFGGGGSSKSPKKVVKKAVKKAVGKPAAKASSPFNLFGSKAPTAKKPLVKKVVKKPVKKVAPAPKKVVKKAVKVAPRPAPKKVFKKAAPRPAFKKAATKPASSPFSALFAPKAPAAKKPAFKRPISKPKPAPKPPPPPPARRASPPKATPAFTWSGSGQRLPVKSKPDLRYTTDVNPQRAARKAAPKAQKPKSASDDDFSPLPLVSAVAVGAFFLKITSAPPPPTNDGGALVPLLAVTALAGLAAFLLTGNDAKMDTPATPPTPVPMPEDAAPADAPADAPAAAAEPDAAEPAAKTEGAPPS